jgi:hypothetical protein
VAVVIDGKNPNARPAERRLLARSEAVTIQHSNWATSVDRRTVKIFGGSTAFTRQRLQQNTLSANPLLDGRQSFPHQEGYIAASSPPCLRQGQASHDVASSNLDSAFGADNQVARLFQSGFSSVLMHDFMHEPFIEP